MSRLGQRVRDIRLKKGLTTKAVAKKLGVSESYLMEVEDGRRILNENLVNRLSKVLGVSLSENGDFFGAAAEETLEIKAASTAKTKGNLAAPKKQVNTPSSPPAPQWEQAFSAIIQDVPVYNQSLSKVLFNKKLVIQDKKVEGIPTDKAFYIQIENTGTNALNYKKGDLILAQKTSDIQTAGTYVIDYQDTIRICEIKPLSNNLLLLGSKKGTLATETANVKEVTVVGKCIRAEIML